MCKIIEVVGLILFFGIFVWSFLINPLLSWFRSNDETGDHAERRYP